MKLKQKSKEGKTVITITIIIMTFLMASYVFDHWDDIKHFLFGI